MNHRTQSFLIAHRDQQTTITCTCKWATTACDSIVDAIDQFADHCLEQASKAAEDVAPSEAEEYMEPVPGKRYRVLYRIEGLHRVDHECVLDYIWPSRDGFTYIFSGRPVIGTQEIEKRWVRQLTEVPKSTPIVPGRRAR